MNPETKPEEILEDNEPNPRAETERIEREEKRREREAECEILNAVVDKINTLIDRANTLTSERINIRHCYADASIRLEMDRTEANAAELRTINNRWAEIDREHFNVSRQISILEIEYEKLVKAYDDKWSLTTWGGGVATLLGSAISKLIGGYLTATAQKKTP